jgi:hypothetical protein
MVITSLVKISCVNLFQTSSGFETALFNYNRSFNVFQLPPERYYDGTARPGSLPKPARFWDGLFPTG